MKRWRMSRRSSRRVFRRGLRWRSRNDRLVPMRGGYRL